MTPRLYSLSTVCLLKHYNQDYLLHRLRTDFTGDNGVGKSIIADLFQVVFVADTRFIKFATEGIDKKKRRLEKLPYDSGIGYVFFNVEVTEGAYITVGVAIFAHGAQLVKPFIITSSIELEKDKIEDHTFSKEKLLFSSNFLKPGGEPYLLDELARILPDKHDLYAHYFSTKEERMLYYEWLYQKELLPINLAREGNLKAFAKVVQSFSKSKALDIDNSKNLIEYLFEEDEIEINQEYHAQEQTLKKLLFQFKSTKDQINDISGKQADLLKLKEYGEEKNAAEYKYTVAKYVQAYQAMIKMQDEFDRMDVAISNKSNRLERLNEDWEDLSNSLEEANRIAQREHNAFAELAGKQSLFEKLKELRENEQLLKDIDTEGLMIEIPSHGYAELLAKEPRYYHENIERSRAVLKRYNTPANMEAKKEQQDTWLRNQLKQIEEKETQLNEFRNMLFNVGQNNLFAKALSTDKNLNKVQQAVLMHLRKVLLKKPEKAKEGIRYVDSIDLIYKLEIAEDKTNNGWWLRTGELHEFVPQTPTLLPDLSKINFTNLEELKEYLDKQVGELQAQKKVYIDLQNGIIAENFSEYDFDIDLSDATKITSHKLAAQLCAIVNHKIAELQKEQVKEAREIEKAKEEYGIALEGVEYNLLLQKSKGLHEETKARYDELNQQYNDQKTEIRTLQETLPLLKQNFESLSTELGKKETEFQNEQDLFLSKYSKEDLPLLESTSVSNQEVARLQKNFSEIVGTYIATYNQIVGKFAETKDGRDIRVNEQIRNQNFSFEILEQSLLGSKIRTLDGVTNHLEALNTELLAIADDLLGSLVKVFGKTESYFDRYKQLVNDLNDFFSGKLISNRFYFRIEFESSSKLDIKWIEFLRKAASGLASKGVSGELTPEQFIEELYMQYSGNKSKVSVEELLNPKSYFVLKARLTDKNGKDIPGSTGESYTAIALLGIARLSIVQDGKRSGLRFIILEESATLDNHNFGLFPAIAKEYGYQIITMTPKPYAIGDEDGWIIHQLIPGKENKDINYSKTMSYFRTNKSQMELGNYLKARDNELANV
jgi:hypothetical protein